ncbi:MAG: hypothetical protein SFZ02_11730 [bacterium]|nr:hypothetical protein [bacterium]
MTVKDIIQQVEQLSPAERQELFLYMMKASQDADYLPISEYEDGDDDEMTKEEVLNSLHQAMKEALAGNLRPAHEALEEIERELRDDANKG